VLIDTHCHLDDKRYEEDLDEVIARAKANGVEKMIIPGADIATLSRAVDIAAKYEDIYYAVGVHPYDIDSYDEQRLEDLGRDKKCVAVGECGLDYFRLPQDSTEKENEKRRQKHIFIKQIELANRLELPLIVHIREASNDSYELLSEHTPKYGAVLHCFNADSILLKLVDKNFYYGIGGVLTFKNAKRLVEILPKIPKERIVIETDAPYLTPHPHRGERNEPFYTTLVAQKIAEVLELSVDDVEQLSSANAASLFAWEA